MHGRVAMVAALGFFVQEALFHPLIPDVPDILAINQLKDTPMPLAVLLVPNPRLDYREHGEILYDHGLAPLFALFLWAAARDTAAASKASTLFAHPALASIGKCSFEVYLFQWPVHTIFYGLGLPTSDHAANFVAFALTLYMLAALYEVHVERPYVRWLRERFAAPPLRTASQSSLAAF